MLGSSVVWQGEHTYEKVPFIGLCFDCEKVLVIGVCFEKVLAAGVDVMTQVCLVSCLDVVDVTWLCL